ncbi:hypothetical protein [Glycomyces albidus]|jgi:hypothetical protein|uniref:ATP-binding protein n=1 Tax=Glycomyces albidus TaxID=2656774 RepID=A0A6L5GAH0_9ACTN|nr:hypothetical protein [Glycomyces albidus]MQM26655.1 hypothetical protein [Glycomyces albidus]
MKQMKMRTVRTAGLVGGLATGALLLAGTAVQAADNVEESAGDLVMATPEALGGLPVSSDAVGGVTSGVTEKVPGLGAVGSVPGLSLLAPPADAKVDTKADAKADAKADGKAGAKAEAKGDRDDDEPKGDRNDAPRGGQDEAPQGGPLDALPVGDLLSGLGGGLPVPLPF